MKMKKKIETLPLKTLCPLLLCAVLTGSLCACGAAAAPSDPSTDSGTTQNDPAGEADIQSEQSTGTDADTISGKKDGSEANDNGPGTDTLTEDSPVVDPETDTTVSTFPSHIQIEMQSEKKDLTADDGTIYYTTSYVYPVISIEGNADAA